MNEQMTLLVRLQEMDLELDELKEDLDSIPERIQYYNNILKEEIENAQKDKEEIKRLQIEQKKYEIEISSLEEKIKKHKTEMNVVKTNEQYKALLSEISECEKQVDRLETEILKILEQIDNINLNIKNTAIKLKNKEIEINGAIKKLEMKKIELENMIKEKSVIREEFAKKIVPSILSKYQHIRASREGVAITSIIDGACGSCHIKLIQQIINIATKVANTPDSHELVFCDNCSRILYVEDKKNNGIEGSNKSETAKNKINENS